MFLLSDIKQTRVYQEARQEGRQEGRQNEAKILLLRQLSKRFGKLSDLQKQRRIWTQISFTPLALS